MQRAAQGLLLLLPSAWQAQGPRRQLTDAMARLLFPAALGLSLLPFGGRTRLLGALPLCFAAFRFFGIRRQAADAEAGRREEIERELPRFVGVLAVALAYSRDVPRLLENYVRHLETPLAGELRAALADMNSGSYEQALQRLDLRVGSPLLSQALRGLLGVLRGDDGTAYFRLLAHDLQQLELQKLKKQAQERVPGIRRCSGVLAAVFVAVTLAVAGAGALEDARKLFGP
jgi:tight adherence protein C